MILATTASFVTSSTAENKEAVWLYTEYQHIYTWLILHKQIIHLEARDAKTNLSQTALYSSVSLSVSVSE